MRLSYGSRRETWDNPSFLASVSDLSEDPDDRQEHPQGLRHNCSTLVYLIQGAMIISGSALMGHWIPVRIRHCRASIERGYNPAHRSLHRYIFRDMDWHNMATS
jgi:hypothetical protein